MKKTINITFATLIMATFLLSMINKDKTHPGIKMQKSNMAILNPEAEKIYPKKSIET